MESVLKSQSQLKALCMQRMDEFQADLEKATGSNSAASLAADFNSFRSFMMITLKSLQDQINMLAQEVDKQEMRSRRKILLFHGIPEQETEDPVATVVSVVTNNLKIVNFSAADISRCHRIGSHLTSAKKPRPILLKTRDLNCRNEVWSAKKALKGSGVTLAEFLTKSRHDTFMRARQRFGITKCWTRDGCVYVLTPDGNRLQLRDITDVDNIPDPALLTSAPSKTLPTVGKTRRGAKVSKK